MITRLGNQDGIFNFIESDWESDELYAAPDIFDPDKESDQYKILVMGIKLNREMLPEMKLHIKGSKNYNDDWIQWFNGQKSSDKGNPKKVVNKVKALTQHSGDTSTFSQTLRYCVKDMVFFTVESHEGQNLAAFSGMAGHDTSNKGDFNTYVQIKEYGGLIYSM